MDNKLFLDSAYGSLSGFLSSNSNSSYTMSLSDCECPEHQPPSTSGCSSDFANSTSQKEKRKEKLKQYLKQLKQIVAPESNVRGSQISTIGALKHVISSYQKSKDENKIEAQDAQQGSQDFEKCTSISTNFTSTSESENEMNIISMKSEDELQILVSTKGLKITQVSPNLKKFLGYPVDSWIGRELTSFLHRKDVVTVNSSYGYEDSERLENACGSLNFDEEENTSVEASKKTIYCRLRHYKGLKHGFSIDKRDHYTSFQATVSTKTVMKVDEFNLEKKRQYLLLECRPLTSAYKNWSDLPTDKRTFSARHSLFCSYTYIHPNAIQLLGFLPQDMIGMSIFDFYHPEDFEHLYNIYKQVVNSKGSTVSSPKIRFRTHNGDWIYVKTEWSRFINPWSKRLEFIIGQHTVIKGPHCTDVFSPPASQDYIAEESEKCQKNLRQIRKLLLQPVVDGARTVASYIDDEPTDVSIAPKEEHLDSSDLVEETKKKFQQPVSADIPCCQLLDNNLSGTYEQLNYTNNIKRFLMSQPKTYSSPSEKRSSGESLTDDSNAIDSDEVPDFEVDIPLPKPPSFCSSTKVLVSEKEEMVPSPSCQIEEISEDCMKEAQTTVPTLEEPNVVMSLTEDTLQEHTKRQEQMYVELAKQDNSLVLLNVTSKHSVLQDSSHRLKRGHSPDDEGMPNIKSFKSGDVNLLHPPFPIPTLDNKIQKKDNPPNQAFPGMYNVRPNVATSLGVYHVGPMPVVQLVPKNVTFQSSTAVTLPNTASNPGNVQWPYYPQSGLSFYPQVMGGFYHQPVTVFSYPTPMWTTPGLKGPRATNTQAIFTQAGDKGYTSMSFSDDTSSQENTSSSLMFLMEPSNNSELEQVISKGKAKIQQVRTRPNQRDLVRPWLFGVSWTESTQMRYTVPRRKFNRIMKEDRDNLKLMKQSDLVLEQMAEFKENIGKGNEDPTEDEEADFLFMIDPDAIKDDISSDSRENDNFQFSDSKAVDYGMSKSNSLGKFETSSDENISFSMSGSDPMDVQEKNCDSECDSIQKSADNDSTVDVESTYSKLSELTPSDARSSDEKGSSMKESDSFSSKNSDGNKDSESENDMNQTKTLTDQFDKFFVKNPTKFRTHQKGFWISEAEFSPKIALEYQMKSNKTRDVLLNDLNRLNEMKQSSVVQDQLSFLLVDIIPSSSSQRAHCSCSQGMKSNEDVKCVNCIQNRQENKLSDNFFDSLFMQPMFQENDDEFSGELPLPQSPDMNDLCDIIDMVD